MRVNLPDYRLYRTLDGYFIEPLQDRKAAYYLYKMIGNYKTTVEGPVIVDGYTSTDPVQIGIAEEGSFIIKVSGYSETPSQAKNYYIRHYPTLKDRLIPNIRALICNCESSYETLCGDGQYNASQKTKNDIYLAISSIVSYKDLLTSPCFTKFTEFSLKILLGEAIDKYVNKLETWMDFVDNYGYSPDTESYVRELMSLIFVTAYYAESSVIDFDYVATGATRGATDYNDGEQDALDELFDFESLEDCYFSKFNININEWMGKFESAYQNQVYACITGVSSMLADDIGSYEEIIIEETGEVDTGSFEILSGSLVFINGIVVPSTDYTYSGTVVTFNYNLSANDRVTIVK